VEINAKVAEMLKENVPTCEVLTGSILDIRPPSSYDFVYTSGLLVTIEGEYLPLAYDTIYSSSSRYICIIEYYNPSPVEINYRGKTGILFKRDFAGEMLDKYSDLALVDYGFVYHKDPNFPLDDLNWFLLEKVSRG
jgi:spore coat polysaccharide biosynthesis protein SpsF